MAQGYNEAVQSGTVLKQLVKNELKPRGYHFRGWRADGGNGDLLVAKQVLEDVPYRSMYGGLQKKTHFLILESPTRHIRLHTFWQETSGSTDEKYPFILWNARDNHIPENEIVLLVDGEGASPQAISWLKREAAACRNKRILVLNQPQFRRWVKDELLNRDFQPPTLAPDLVDRTMVR